MEAILGLNWQDAIKIYRFFSRLLMIQTTCQVRYCSGNSRVPERLCLNSGRFPKQPSQERNLEKLLCRLNNEIPIQ